MQVSNLAKSYGDDLVFERASFTINIGDRVGLVGPNGCGKTTLLRILMGELLPDVGSVQMTHPDERVGYLAQALTYETGATVQDALSDDTASHDSDHWAARVEALAHEMATVPPERMDELNHRYAEALERLSTCDEGLPDHVVHKVLAGLGLRDLLPDTPVSTLSGGQKTRLGLARLLLRQPTILLLDEPTNHLDIDALEWLEAYLCQYKGGMLIVSHDRAFLNGTVTRILELDPATHHLSEYDGNYDTYVQVVERERQKHAQAYHEQQERIARLQGAVRELKGHAGKIERETTHFHYRKRAKKVARQAVVRQKRIERLLESEERVDKPELHWDMKLDFVNTPPSGQDVITIEGLGKRYGERWLFRDVDLLLRKGEQIAFIGPNGAGKTTLVRIIAGQLEPTEGTVRLGSNVQVGYMAQEQENLDWEKTPIEIICEQASLGASEARGFLHFFLFAGDDVFVPVGRLSYGERARLALGTLVLRGCNLLLLDEPINHLDIASRERFEQALATFEGTVVAVAHDRYFVSQFATGLWVLDEGAVSRYVDLSDWRRARKARQVAGNHPLMGTVP